MEVTGPATNNPASATWEQRLRMDCLQTAINTLPKNTDCYSILSSAKKFYDFVAEGKD